MSSLFISVLSLIFVSLFPFLNHPPPTQTQNKHQPLNRSPEQQPPPNPISTTIKLNQHSHQTNPNPMNTATKPNQHHHHTQLAIMAKTHDKPTYKNPWQTHSKPKYKNLEKTPQQTTTINQRRYLS